MYAEMRPSEIWDDIPDIHRVILGNLHTDIVTYISANPESVNEVDYTKRPALHCAAAAGNANFVRTLLLNGANINTQNVLGKTALSTALGYRSSGLNEVIRILLRHGLDTTLVDRYGCTCLDYVPRIECPVLRLDLIRKSLQASDYTTRTHGRSTPLMTWATIGDCTAEEVDLLLKAGIDINAQNSYGYTAIAYAVIYKRVNLSRILIERGASLKAEVWNGYYKSHNVAKQPNIGVVHVIPDGDHPGTDVGLLETFAKTLASVFERKSAEYGGFGGGTREAFYAMLEKVASFNRVQETKSEDSEQSSEFEDCEE